MPGWLPRRGTRTRRCRFERRACASSLYHSLAPSSKRLGGSLESDLLRSRRLARHSFGLDQDRCVCFGCEVASVPNPIRSPIKSSQEVCCLLCAIYCPTARTLPLFCSLDPNIFTYKLLVLVGIMIALQRSKPNRMLEHRLCSG